MYLRYTKFVILDLEWVFVEVMFSGLIGIKDEGAVLLAGTSLC